MMLPSHGPEPCASANSATSAHCGRWDLNPHEHTPTRSLVLPVCQFQHSRLLLFIFACRVSHSLTKLSIAQALRECKHFFVFYIFLIVSFSDTKFFTLLYLIRLRSHQRIQHQRIIKFILKRDNGTAIKDQSLTFSTVGNIRKLMW